MSDARFLHGFDIAPAANVQLVHGGEGPIEFGGYGNPTPLVPLAKVNLSNKSTVSLILADVPVKDVNAGHHFQVDPSDSFEIDRGWETVITDSQQWLLEHVSKFPVETCRRLGYLSVYETSKKMQSAALGGVATMGALLEATPRVLMAENYDNPNDEIRKIALKSLGFVYEWMGLDQYVDFALAYALSRRKPSSPNDVFEGLRFNTKYLSTDSTGKRIILDPVKADHLRDASGRNHPRVHQLQTAAATTKLPNRSDLMQKPIALFGCPMPRAAVRAMYFSMVRSAVDGGLLAATYHHERRNHGY